MISIGDPKHKHTPDTVNTPEDLARRQKAADAARLFGGSARVSGPKLDFNRKSAPAAKTSGMGGLSLLDAYRDPALDLDNK